MKLQVALALAEFNSYIVENFGGRIDLSLLRAFAVLVTDITDALINGSHE